MKFLERYISAYTGTNLFLGVFTTEKLAKENKNRYIEEVENNDSFKHQTHHLKMMEEKDEIFVTEYEIEKYILNELYL